ncbi:MAG TPA: UDP-2,4-diacetamido-2,4,6-trideoxy-beta-L-altropyranose hydrolase [Fibrobacteria bacterium]|nr:UDP-2,4-diacetamido-2,4,6-trideoxy-beta-L-altropyranose hydrolase [Fibrobacteria bacterium]
MSAANPAPRPRGLDIAFRVDASVRMGTGHVARCLCLADAFAERGDKVRFLTREFDPAVSAWLRGRGHETIGLPAPPPGAAGPEARDHPETWLGVPWQRDAEEVGDALAGTVVDLLVADHYGLDRRWESRVRPIAHKVMVLDDGGDRHHDCDVLLDQNLHGEGDPGPAGRVPGHCRLLLGPRFALLRPEFRLPGEEAVPRDGSLRSVLVFFGGSDPTNEAGKALEGLLRAGGPELRITVVAGGLNPHMAELEKMKAALPGLTVHRQVDFMARLMREADLAIGAGGTATWERCRMGLPALVAILAENQAEIAAAVAAAGAQRTLGWGRDLGPEDYAAAVRRLDAETLSEMSRAGMRLVDGKGCERVVRMVADP